ncbi:TPA: hypothetical protein ACX3FR_004600 [Vibrio parahaemolyticus]
MQWIESVLALVTTTSILIAIVTWVGKKLVSYFLKKDIEKFKIELSKEMETAKRQLSFELDKRLSEHQLKMERLYDQRALVIAKTYGLLVSCHSRAIKYISGYDASYEKNDFERDKKEILDLIGEFFEFFSASRIYLPESVCDQIDSFMMDIRKYTVIYHRSISKDEYMLEKGISNEEVQSSIDEAIRSAHLFIDTSKESRYELERELRYLMGETSNVTSKSE